MRALRLKIFIMSFLLVLPFAKAVAKTEGECRQVFSSTQVWTGIKAWGKKWTSKIQGSQSKNQELETLSPIQGSQSENQELVVMEAVQQILQERDSVETNRPSSPPELLRFIAEGGLLSREQALDFKFYLKIAFEENSTGKGLKDVEDIRDQYTDGQLDKTPVRTRKITFTIKKRTLPESLILFVKSLRSRANRVRPIFQISANWGYWAKLLNLKKDRERFFEYIDSGPLGQFIGEFIKNEGLSFNISTEQTVREFIENPSSPYIERTIVLYKVLDYFRQQFIQQAESNKNLQEEITENLSQEKNKQLSEENNKNLPQQSNKNLPLEIAKNLSIAMAELIHVTGFGDSVLTEQLKSKDASVVIEAVRQILQKRDFMAINLGFQDHYQGLQSFLLDGFHPNQVNSVKKELSSFENEMAKILQDISHQPQVESYTQTFKMRALNEQESPFRGCLGKDCSTTSYFEKALDPAYLYFTLTDSHFISHGHITVVLGTATNQEGKSVKTAFVDKIQNIPNYRIIGMLEAIRQSLDEQGYKMVLPTELGGEIEGLTNSVLTRDFVKNKILTELKNSFKDFKPEDSGLPFENGYSRVDQPLNLLEFEWTQNQRDFEIQPLEIPQPKKLDENFSIKDWLLKAMQSNNEKDQFAVIVNAPALVSSQFLYRKTAEDYLQSKIENQDLSFELRKKALFAVIQLQVLDKAQIELQEFQFLESLMLKFPEKELTTIIGEMSNWKKSNIKYHKDFSVGLSYLFDYVNVAFLVFRIPSFFEHVIDLNIKDEYDLTALHRVAKAGKYKMAEWLIERGADPNIKGGREWQYRYLDKWTPLHYAIWKGHIKTVKALIEGGADPNAKDKYGRTPLHTASAIGYIEGTQLLLDGGTNLPQRESAHIVKGIQLLLDGGANPNSKDKEGRTPLHIASLEIKIGTTRLLLDRGADPNAKDKYGQTPLHLGSLEKETERTQLLLDGGADPNAKDKYGQTPLHKAIYLRNTERVKALIEAGANPNIKDKEGKTPVDIAFEREHTEIVQIFRPAGFKGNLEK